MREIFLAKGRGAAIVDDEDYELVAPYRWYLSNAGYVVCSVPDPVTRQHTLRLHRLILGLDRDSPLEGDHIDGDKLNNRRSNLRVVTRRQNSYNRRSTVGSSRYKGVTWDANAGKWRARLEDGEKKIHLGLYNTEEDAALAYDEEALRRFGPYARTNFAYS